MHWVLAPSSRICFRPLIRAVTAIALLAAASIMPPQSAHGQTGAYCQFSANAIAEKNQLRQLALQGDTAAQEQYKNLLGQHAQQLQNCRNQTWPQEQALWVRLYPCDARPGALDQLMDEVVNKGYNRVHVEALYNGQILLPEAANTTPWPSVIRTPGHENVDLLAAAIAKGRERGLEVYAWVFSMNAGYTYGQRSDRQSALAYNGWGQTSLTARSQVGINAGGSGNTEEVFVDPYSLTAKQDFYGAVEAIAQRRPDGILFDYIRYPRGSGANSVADEVQDLWIYGPSSQQVLQQRALNQRGRELIRRFISQGYISSGDIDAVKSLYPQETEPQWQGRSPSARIDATSSSLQPYLHRELWALSVAHAMQGVLDFLAVGTLAAERQGLPGGAVFFPDGNQTVGQGFDSRLQPWDRFPSTLEWHPMSYATCGNTSCITAQVLRVVQRASYGTEVKPVLAGTWGQSTSDRPSLELQMQSIRQAAPRINSISHFAYSWQEPQRDQERKFCQLR